MRKRHWPEFLFSLGRIILLLILLAVVLPKLIAVCSTWLTSITHKDERPSGNPMRVEEKASQTSVWSQFVIRLFP